MLIIVLYSHNIIWRKQLYSRFCQFKMQVYSLTILYILTLWEVIWGIGMTQAKKKDYPSNKNWMIFTKYCHIIR